MKKILLLCTMAIINAYALRFEKLFAETDASVHVMPPQSSCSKASITEYAKSFPPGERFKCTTPEQEWRCVKTTGGYSCDVTENWSTK